ncbi:MAG: TolC family protein [Planctomycetes bacterium]|nr:TolC family protein [Planctomycetota bacterium]
MFKIFIKTCLFILLFLVQACVSPLATESGAESQKTTIDKKETNSHTENSSHDKTIHLPDNTPSIVELSLKDRAEELEALSPSGDSDTLDVVLGVDLEHKPAASEELSIENAVVLAIENNLDIQLSALQPQIAAQSVIAAEAAFDFVLGAGASKKRSRIHQQQAVASGNRPVSSAERASDIFSSNASLTKKLNSGGTFTLSTDVTKTDTESIDFDYSPDPAWQTIGTVDLTQPLLRNFGEKVTLSQIHLSQIDKNKTTEDLRKTLNEVITTTEQNYLDLCLQWRKLQINQWLLEQGEAVVRTLELRMAYDTSMADYAQAVATVQQRRADVISQQSAVHDASDSVKKLINTSEYPLDSETIIKPTTIIQANTVSISLRQALVTAIENRPDLRALALDIQTSEINIVVAKNAQLPQLDMQAQMSFYGLGDTTGRGYEEVFDGDYVNYLAGLSLSIPLGNRSAKANSKITRLQQMSAIASYKKGIQQATIDIKQSLRNIVTNASLMRANKDYRIAQTENLRALLVEEETMAGLTPTFLNLKLQTQSGLASARTAEITAVINYNKSIAQLYKAMGTTTQKHQVGVD